ncbi:MAG: VCBS repeat-containing protein [Acidobacteria bacterium]|nr:VCBS repeat-containing protein [Acidobacteriota bacterium]
MPRKYLVAGFMLALALLIIRSNSASMQTTDAASAPQASVSITYPANNSNINVPTNIFVSADVTGGGNISRVDFFANDMLIGSDTSAPYFIVWNDPFVTTYNITAVAVDSGGGQSPSQPITITTTYPGSLYPLPIPGPTLLSPTEGSTFTSLTDITLSSTRSQTQYTVARVEFYDNTTLIGSDTTEPYSIVWQNAPPGTHSITARTVVTTGARASSRPADIRIIPSNAAAITLGDLTPASPYPSSIQINGLTGSVSSLSLTLQNLSHTAPDDIDLLLVAPNGRSVLLMSDVGGTVPISNLTLTIDGASSNPMPDDGPLTSGTYRPTNYGGGDSFPAPAPANAPQFVNLSDLNGSNPNGTWSLYAVDDEGNNVGSISGGWGLIINTSTTICGFNITPTQQVFPHTGGTGTIDLSATFASCDWSASSQSSFLTITSGLTGTGSGVVSFTVAPNMGAARTGRMTVAGRTFSVQQGSGCPFALSQETLQVSGAGGALSVGVSAAGICGWNATTGEDWITINAGSGTGDGTVGLTIAPNSTGNPRTGTVMIGARTLTINQSATTTPVSHAPFDFDADGKTDIGVYRPSEGNWYQLLSLNNVFRQTPFGNGTDRLMPADFDADGRADICVWRPETGTWHLLQSSDGAYVARTFGTSGDIPVARDFDGDGKADLTVFRPSSGGWYILQSSDGNLRAQQFGANGDQPVAADFDGDGKADLAVFRPSNGGWYVLRSSDGAFFAQNFGASGDRAVTSDYDGDGKSDVAVFRADGTWYIWQSASQTLRAQPFGASGDVPAPGDYDGDAHADLAVFRPATGTWYILRSTNGALDGQQFGANGDVPLPSAYVP